MAVFYRRLPKFQYLFPKTVEEALRMLSEHKGDSKLIAGGTDLVPALKRREINVPGYIIDLKAIPGLDAISFDKKTGLKIGPLATISTIAESAVIADNFPCLAQSALTMASPQVRNRGTFAGNICNAVPSADSAPSLLALSASVKIKGLKGERTVPVEQFFTGPRKTVLMEDEMLIEILVPSPSPGSKSIYLKLSPRHSMDLAIVGIAVNGKCENGNCMEIKIALGAVAPTPLRAPVSENILQGKRVTPEIIKEASLNAITQCSPIDDHRASQEYRCDMVNVMTRRALTQVLLG
jgi:CO/xanthine dehydrogenase FAD-binding subunit